MKGSPKLWSWQHANSFERLLEGFKGQRLLEVEQFLTNLWRTHLSVQTSQSLSSHHRRIPKKLSTEAAAAPLNYSCFANDKLRENKPILVYLMNDRVEEIATTISGCSWYTWETPFWGIFIFGENNIVLPSFFLINRYKNSSWALSPHLQQNAAQNKKSNCKGSRSCSMTSSLSALLCRKVELFGWQIQWVFSSKLFTWFLEGFSVKVGFCQKLIKLT